MHIAYMKFLCYHTTCTCMCVHCVLRVVGSQTILLKKVMSRLLWFARVRKMQVERVYTAQQIQTKTALNR